MRDDEPNAMRWQAILRGIILIPLGGAIFCHLIWQFIPVGALGGVWAAVGLGLGLVPAALVATVVHELGHALGALAVRLPVLHFNVWGLHLDLGARQIAYAKAPGADAFVLAGPNGTGYLRSRVAFYTLAGPVVGLLFAGVCVWLAWLLQPDLGAVPRAIRGAWWLPWVSPASAWVALCNVTAAFSLIAALESLLPCHKTNNDAALLLDCLSNRSGLIRLMAVLALLQELAQGIRPRDWTPEWSCRLSGEANGSGVQGWADLMGFFLAEDCERQQEAGQLIDQALEARTEMDYPQRRGVYLEAAYHIAFHRGDAQTARSWLNRVDRDGIEDHTWLRAEAAILGAEGKVAEALGLIETALEAVPRSKDPGGAIAEKDWLERMRRYYLDRAAAVVQTKGSEHRQGDEQGAQDAAFV